jgi:hypothetical protein
MTRYEREEGSNKISFEENRSLMIPDILPSVEHRIAGGTQRMTAVTEEKSMMTIASTKKTIKEWCIMFVMLFSGCRVG